MGGLAPGRLKSRRGSHSSPRRSHRPSHGIQELTAWKTLSTLRAGRHLTAINSWRTGPFWSAKVSHSFTAANTHEQPPCKQRSGTFELFASVPDELRIHFGKCCLDTGPTS